MICDFCKHDINEMSGRKGVESSHGACICDRCISWAKKAIGDPAFASIAFIDLPDYKLTVAIGGNL